MNGTSPPHRNHFLKTLHPNQAFSAKGTNPQNSLWGCPAETVTEVTSAFPGFFPVGSYVLSGQSQVTLSISRLVLVAGVRCTPPPHNSNRKSSLLEPWIFIYSTWPSFSRVQSCGRVSEGQWRFGKWDDTLRPRCRSYPDTGFTVFYHRIRKTK